MLLMTAWCAVEAQPSVEVTSINFIDSSSAAQIRLSIHSADKAIAIRSDFWFVYVDSAKPRFTLMCGGTPANELSICSAKGAVGSIACSSMDLDHGDGSLFFNKGALFHTVPSESNYSLTIDIPLDSVGYTRAKAGKQLWIRLPYWDADEVNTIAQPVVEQTVINNVNTKSRVEPFHAHRQVIFSKPSNNLGRHYNRWRLPSPLNGDMTALVHF